MNAISKCWMISCTSVGFGTDISYLLLITQTRHPRQCPPQISIVDRDAADTTLSPCCYWDDGDIFLGPVYKDTSLRSF